jgi:hypothetical protein
MKKETKRIEYEIKAKLWFETDEDVKMKRKLTITEYLDKLREIGEAEIVNVKIVEDKE